MRRVARRKRAPLLAALFLFALLVCLFRFVLFVGFVPTASMEPTIRSGSLLVASRIYRDLQRGDIVVFTKDHMVLVKRIHAVAGDAVYVNQETREVSVNVPVSDAVLYMVPEDCYFVVGDNKAVSRDSRFWTNPFVSEMDIIAKYNF